MVLPSVLFKKVTPAIIEGLFHLPRFHLQVSYSNFDTAFLGRKKKIMDEYLTLRLSHEVLHSLCPSDS